MKTPLGGCYASHTKFLTGSIAATLLELSSDEISEILDRAGLSVDLSLDEKEGYSEKTRKRAYRPRIHGAYEALGGDDQLRVAYITASELSAAGHADKLNESLSKIGWRIDFGKLRPTEKAVTELFFPRGTPHDAYVEIRTIVRGAKASIVVIDPYLDESIFALLSNLNETVNSVKLLTLGIPADFLLEETKFLSQNKAIHIEVRQSREFHDRFCILDKTECWHLGASIKDAGGKAFMISRIEDESIVAALTAQLIEAWENATPLSI